MISSSFFSAVLAILAVNGVQAGPCRLTTETSLAIEPTATETTLPTNGETTMLSVTTTEVSVATTEVTPAPSTTTTEASVSTSGANTFSEDASSTETTGAETTGKDTTTTLLTTTMQTLQSTTTSTLTTTTNAASGGGDSCSDNIDCLLSIEPLCALGLCVCVDARCSLANP
ncbi:hypothetical protein FPOAC2_11868 [Fusarium poae]|uniref:Extracellular membrane protein CFEM domain-containing protein n=1 Tax=Fusarium poae TaxID=36050 RepID=A0A1B8AET9_FUSPO|nr:hypothetical protein FPOAC1_011560 [Fusarium poae]KAG8666744.1 hypothetical protein FPOAC1_011560 [Fusarium poae]OBS18996.1 hypothetical protein FPOA_10721 [Fusarium poae]